MHTIRAVKRGSQTAFGNHPKQSGTPILSSWRAPGLRSTLPCSPFFHPQGVVPTYGSSGNTTLQPFLPPHGVTPAEGSSGSTTLQRLRHCPPHSGTARSLRQRIFGCDPSAARSAGLEFCQRADLRPEAPHGCIRQPSHCFVTSAATAQSFGRVSRLPLSEEDFLAVSLRHDCSA